MENPTDPRQHHDLISTLSLEQGMPSLPLRKYQGVWMPEYLMPGIINMQQARCFVAPTDILLVSYPKCGTTWLKALAFAAITRTQHSFAADSLLDLNPHDCMPFLEAEASSLERLSKIDAMEGPRLLATHLPFHMLPESIKTSGCRLAYICRDPKDTVTSLQLFLEKRRVYMATSKAVTMSRVFEMFCQGISPYGPIWDHALGYWKESLRAPERALFLRYEDILEDPTGKLTRLAEFMGCPFTEEEVTAGVPAEIVSLCSFKNLRDLALKHNRTINFDKYQTTESFYRKGEAGDWKNHLTPEMAQRLDQITQEKLLGTGLVLGRPSSESTTMNT